MTRGGKKWRKGTNLNRLLEFEDVLEPREDVFDVVLRAGLLSDQKNVGQDERNHVGINELLLETRNDALKADSLGKLVNDLWQALEEHGLLEVVVLERRVQVLERFHGNIVKERYLATRRRHGQFSQSVVCLLRSSFLTFMT